MEYYTFFNASTSPTQLPKRVPHARRRRTLKTVIHQAAIADVIYVEMTSCEAKIMFRYHFQSFNDERKKEEIALATHIWDNRP